MAFAMGAWYWAHVHTDFSNDTHDHDDGGCCHPPHEDGNRTGDTHRSRCYDATKEPLMSCVSDKGLGSFLSMVDDTFADYHAAQDSLPQWDVHLHPHQLHPGHSPAR